MKKNYGKFLVSILIFGTQAFKAQCPISAPSPVNASPTSICGGASSTLNATAPGGSINWYTVGVGGTPTGTSASGANFVVSPVVTTTYYAEARAVNSTTYNFTGAMQTYTVPPSGVTQITINCYAASGVSMGLIAQPPGYGGRAQGVLTVTPGQVLNLFVGGNNGWNGGGADISAGANGGGASDVRTGGVALSNRIIVAGGGGGVGGSNYVCFATGHGGGGTAVGSNFVGGAGGGGYAAGSCGMNGGNSGGAGSPIAAHGGGGGGGGFISGGGGGNSTTWGPAPSGVLGIGGDSNGAPGCAGQGIGGGGGGYYGGGGAAGYNCGGGKGGGGSSWTGTLANPLFQSGVNLGNGRIVIIDFCVSSRVPVTVTVNPSPTITVNSGSVCSGNAFTMTPSGASTYTFQGGNAVVSPTVTTSYTVTGTSAQGCVSQSFATANVTVHAKPIITVNSGSICSGNSFTMVPSGANTYTFQGGSAVVSPTASTSYTVVGTSTAGCTSQSFATSNVTVHAKPIITVNSGSMCSGYSFTMVPSGANTYTFQGGSAVVSPTASTSYTVVGTSTAGCTSQSFATSNIIVSTSPTVVVNSGSICSGNSFTIMPSGANSYTIQGGNAVVSPAASTSYSVVGSNTTGCVSQPAISNVTVQTTPTISVNSGSICQGNSFTIVPSGANSYTIQGGNAVVSPATNTSYTVAGSSGGCMAQNTATSVVMVDASPLPTISVNSGSICAGESFTMVPSGANTYTYEGGSAVVSPTSNVSYTVIGSTAAGCTSQSYATSNVMVNPLPIVIVSGNDTICVDGTATLTANGADTYSWNTGATTSSIVVTLASSTSYSVVGTNTLTGCSDMATALVVVEICTGINNVSGELKGLKLYPNPSKGDFNIELKNGLEKNIVVLDYIGREIQNTNSEKDLIQLNLSSLQSGIYFIKVSTAGVSETYKIIKN
jgi:hypothetical protein